MRAHEFVNRTLCLFAKPGVHSLLEAYEDPKNELEITFKEMANEFGRRDYYAYVTEKATGDLRVRVHFTLDENDKTSLDVGNIEPFLKPGEQGKTVHTSLTTDTTGLDLGQRGVVWMLKKIKEFAKAEGFTPDKIGSSTRYTGARAKNDPGEGDTGLPKHFDVNKSLREMIVLESTNEVKYYLVAE